MTDIINARYTGLKSEHVLREIKIASKNLDLQYEAALLTAGSHRLSQLVKEITRLVQREFNAAASAILLLDEEENLIFEVAGGQVGKDLRGATMGGRYGIAGWVAREGKAAIVNDVNTDPHFDRIVDTVTGFTTRSIMCAPLVTRDKIIGVIEVLNKLDGTGFTEEDLALFTSIAEAAAPAINDAR